MAFTPVGDALQKKMQQQTELQGQVKGAEIIEIAERVFEGLFGDEAALHVKPLFLKNRTLTVTCTSSAVAQEIRLNQANIVCSLNEALGADEVDRIRYLA